VSPVLELWLDREHYSLGDTVSGTVRVVEGGRSRSLEVTLNYNEKTEDYGAVATSVSSGPLNTGELTTGMSFGFALALPPDGFPNYRSEHGELFWEVEARSDEPGLDTRERRRIEVASASAGM
jgi:hypothetical protein